MNEQSLNVPTAQREKEITEKDEFPTTDHYWQYCVNYGTKLEGRKCKLICPKCGFYHSCSEP